MENEYTVEGRDGPLIALPTRDEAIEQARKWGDRFNILRKGFYDGTVTEEGIFLPAGTPKWGTP